MKKFIKIKYNGTLVVATKVSEDVILYHKKNNEPINLLDRLISDNYDVIIRNCESNKKEIEIGQYEFIYNFIFDQIITNTDCKIGIKKQTIYPIEFFDGMEISNTNVLEKINEKDLSSDVFIVDEFGAILERYRGVKTEVKQSIKSQEVYRDILDKLNLSLVLPIKIDGLTEIEKYIKTIEHIFSQVREEFVDVDPELPLFLKSKIEDKRPLINLDLKQNEFDILILLLNSLRYDYLKHNSILSDKLRLKHNTLIKIMNSNIKGIWFIPTYLDSTYI